MSKELEILKEYRKQNICGVNVYADEYLDIIEKALKDYENLKEENKLLRENFENLNETYFSTWYACQKLKENSNYALVFVNNVYCLVDTTDNKFDIIETYTINDKGIIDNTTQKKLRALDIIRDKKVDVSFIIENPEAKNVFWYNSSFTGVLCEGWRMLSQEEYDLIKEVL